MLGSFQLDPSTFQLSRDGEPISLARRPFDLLVELATHPGRITSREELRTRVWAGTKVSEGAIDTALYEARAAVGDLDRPAADRWIETVRGRGFRYRGPAERRASAVPALAPDRDGIPFVGREVIMRELVGTLKKAKAGQGSFVLIEGAAGMGKTRLLQEITQVAGKADVITAWCEVGSPPYWPWIQLMEHLRKDADFDPTEGILTQPLAPNESTAHFDLQKSVEEDLRRAADRKPRLVLVEDIHWADAQSIALLETLVPRLSSWPVSIIATARPDGDGGQRATRLVRSAQVRRLSLRPLDNSAVLKFVEPLLGVIPPADIASEIGRRAEGIPLFIREIAEQTEVLAESEFRIPSIASTVLERRFEPLAETSRLPLALAALCGERFDVPIVEAAGKDAIDAPKAWVKDALQHGILVADARNPLQFAFAHALMRDVAEAFLEPEDKNLWHRRIADAIVERNPDAEGPILSRLARHYAASALLAENLEMPLRFVLLAARSAAKVLAWEDVRVHSDHVLGWIPMVPHSSTRDAQEREARLLRCMSIAGQTGHVVETEEHLARLRILIAASEDPEFDERALAAAFRYSNARTAGKTAEFSTAAREIENVPGMASIADCWRVAAAGLGGQTREAAARLGETDGLPTDPDLRDLGRRCGWDPWVERLGLSAFGCWAAGDTEEALRRCERAVTWAKEQGDPRSEIWALFLLCHLFDLLEDWETLAARAPEIESLCARHSISPWQGFGVGMQIWAQANLEKTQDAATDRMGEIMLAQGRASHTSFKSGILFVAARNYAFADVTDEAERIFDETVRFCEASGERVLLPEVFRWQGLLALKRGDSERAA
ncbi:MAG: AAA family ATPase, partial [Myxococcota bacterium]